VADSEIKRLIEEVREEHRLNREWRALGDRRLRAAGDAHERAHKDGMKLLDQDDDSEPPQG